MFDLFQDTLNSSTPWFKVVPNMEKLCQAMLAENKQANMQPTLNKETGDGSLTIFVAVCLQNKKKLIKVF